MIKLIPTQEQLNIQLAALKGSNLCIKAFAGASKTSTCVMTSQALIKTSLYVAFNKSIADEATTRFPSHVTCSTMHSLAWRSIIKYGRSKMGQKLKGFFDIKEVADMYNNEDQNIEAKLLVLDLIKKYCQSSYKRIDDIFVEYNKLNPDKELSIKVITEAKIFWSKLINENDPTKITHDVYLKMYHLSVPVLPYQVIYLDEFQDTNPVTADIILSQVLYGAQVILVGDDYQSIYEWRGAVNAFDLVVKTGYKFKMLYLTESFRFTQEIADMATALTSIAGNDKKIIGRAELPDVIDFPTRAIIVRNNSTLLTQLLIAEAEQKKVHCLADLKDLWGKLYHISALYYDEKPKYPNTELSQYSNYNELAKAAESIPELKKLINLTTQLSTGGLTANINRIKSVLVTKPEEADITLTTAHRSKGLEWDEVTLTDDLLQLKEDQTVIEALMSDQALNLLYVALTRSKYKVNLPVLVKEVINKSNELAEERKVLSFAGALVV